MRNVENIFAGISNALGGEQLLTLFENRTMKIERIVSQSYHSPEHFWYDQSEPEWVMILRGEATMEFEGGSFVEMKEGDHLIIPKHVKHRVHRTGPQTIWLAAHINQGDSGKREQI